MNKAKTFFILIIFFSSPYLIAQNQINSPYSRFGIGNLQSNILSEFSAMGGVAIANSNAAIVNPYNPASYSTFKPNTFILSTGGIHQTTRMQTNKLQQIANNSSFSHIILGFPINSRIGASFGLLPFSSIGYHIEDSEENPELGNIDYLYNGDGGLNIIYFGTGYKLSENLLIGANINYLFGGLNRQKEVIFTDEEIFSTRKKSSISLKGFYYQLGLQYYHNINENYRIVFGLSANNSTNISSKRTVLTETYELVSSNFEIVKDTIENTTTGFTNSMVLPRNVGFGVSLEMKKWIIMADYSIMDWSEYRMFGDSDSLANSMRLSYGIQYTNDKMSSGKYWKLIKFRFGGKFEKSYLNLYNSQINERSLTFGLGLPLRKTKSEINIAIEIGERGTTNNNLIKEQFLRFNLGLALKDIWFVKRKYD